MQLNQASSEWGPQTSCGSCESLGNAGSQVPRADLLNPHPWGRGQLPRFSPALQVVPVLTESEWHCPGLMALRAGSSGVGGALPPAHQTPPALSVPGCRQEVAEMLLRLPVFTGEPVKEYILGCTFPGSRLCFNNPPGGCTPVSETH